jgi:hypothetical protein
MSDIKNFFQRAFEAADSNNIEEIETCENFVLMYDGLALEFYRGWARAHADDQELVKFIFPKLFV